MRPLTSLPHVRPDSQDAMIVAQVLSDNQYRLPDSFDPADVIVDVGAHVGAFAAACLCRGAGRVVCYEPDPGNRELLRKNLEELFPSGPWEIRDEAWGPPGREGTSARFHATSDGAQTGCASLAANAPSSVPLTSLREALTRPRCSVRLLKIDAEGAEWLTFPYASWEDLACVQEIVGESHATPANGRDHAELPALLKPLGFLCEQEGLAESLLADGSYVNKLFFAKRGDAKPEKPKLLCVRFPYGGVERTEVTDWVAGAVSWARGEDRLGLFTTHKINDTPITMTRNLAEKEARDAGYDLLLMVDSDMTPDCEHGAPPFLPAAFEFWLRHAGPCVVGAPYCGPPPEENPYVFRWRNGQNDTPEPECRIGMYTREEAADMRGVQPCAALPTGLILIDVKAFDALEPPYFYYEFTDAYCTKKASTEDVAFSRDLHMAGVPQYCAWDSWAGHNKNKCVRRPQPVSLAALPDKLSRLAIREYRRGKGDVAHQFPASCG